jgi:hypothetical protein
MTFSKTSVKLLLLAGLLCIAVGTFTRNRLPSGADIADEALLEPIQTNRTAPIFKTTVNKVEYSVAPQADYELRGVVVSKHDSSSFWDVLHSDWNDHLNVADLCIVWGGNLKSDIYRKLSYHNGQFTCNYGGSGEAFSSFNEDEISNNHVLTDDPRLAKKIRQLAIGDQVLVRGKLAKYSHRTGGQFDRGTSMVRNDRGNGACETIFIDDVQVIKSAAKWPSQLRMLGYLVTLIASLLWVFATKVYED